MMMKRHSLLSLLLLVLVLVYSTTKTSACRCVQPTASGALSSASFIFVGTVLRKRKSIDKQQIASVVSVDRIIKGCSLKIRDRVIVTTSSSTAACGVNFVVNATYYFTGDIEMTSPKMLMNTYGLTFNKPINSTMHVSSCSFTVLRSNVSKKDRMLLTDYGKKKNMCPVKCTIGTECPNQEYYCDDGTCQLFNVQCPSDKPPTPCFVDPCIVTEPCTKSLLKCTPYYCGGCYAIYTDANRTRTCDKD